MTEKERLAAALILEFNKRHLKRQSQYEKLVEKLFDEYTDELAALGVKAGKSLGAEPFRFSRFPQSYTRLQKILATFRQSLLSTIVNGVAREWELANEKNDKLASILFGDKTLTDAEKRRYYKNNDDALAAFRQRVVKGLNLSDRVWRYTEQYKEEIEAGLDAGIRDGVSAVRMAKELKQYLQYPDKLFRRVRDEHGNLQLSRAARAFHPSTGVYRSSYKNALRLARTETNMAYRTADHLRYQQLDFVIGIEVHLSNNHTCLGRDGKPHPFRDICDDLAGQYPKDFKFVGWHPQCRCFVTSVLMNDDEVDAMRAARKAGKPLPKSKREVKDVPEAFKRYIEEHRTALDKAANKPYWLVDNYKYTGYGEPPKEEPKHTALDRAAERHAARTPEDIKRIQKEWDYRKTAIELSGEIQTMLGGIPDVDLSKIRELEAKADWRGVRKEWADLSNIYTELGGLEHIPDGVEAARKYGYKATMDANAAIERTMKAKLGASYGRDLADLSDSDLVTFVDRMEFEAKWIADHGTHRATWELARDAYNDAALRAKAEQEKRRLAKLVADVGKYTGYITKDSLYNALVRELQLSIVNADYVHAESVMKQLDARMAELDARMAKLEAEKKRKKRLEEIEDRYLVFYGHSSEDADFEPLVQKLANELMSEKLEEAEATLKRLEAIYRKDKGLANTGDIGTTLDDLKAQYGASLPKTLENLEKAYASYQKRQYCGAPIYSNDVKRHADELEVNMRYLFDKMSWGMNVRPDVMLLVADSKFKNTFETGSSGGYLGSSKTTGKIEIFHSRLNAAHLMFGLSNDLDNDQLQRKEYEKYGNLLDSDIRKSLLDNSQGASGYGEIEVRFKKDKVLATFTADDSLCKRYQPTLVTDPKAMSFDHWRESRLPLGDITSKSMRQIRDDMRTSYIEMQYHGELTIDCVESVAIKHDLHSSSDIYRKVADKWKSLGVPVYYLDKYGDLKQW